MDIQEKINKKIEEDLKVNPLGLKIGDFVSLDGKSVYKILKFNEAKEGVTANINMIYSDDGKKMNRLRIEKFNIDRLKPAFISINMYNERVQNINQMISFLKETMLYNSAVKYDNYGNLKK